MKKKFLAFLLTLMTVALLVPAIVASAVVVPLNAVKTEEVAADERAEVAVHDPLLEEDKVELINKDGVRVGYYATLAEAIANVRAGDTVRLLDNVNIDTMLELNGNFVLDGNGFVLAEGAPYVAPVEPEIPEVEPDQPEIPEVEPDQPENQEPEVEIDPETPENPGDAPSAPDSENNEQPAPVDPEEPSEEMPEIDLMSEEEEEAEPLTIAIKVTGGNVEIRNLIVDMPDATIAIDYYVADEQVSTLTLANCSVMAFGVAVESYGQNAYLTIKGAGSSYMAMQAVAVLGGYADIYGGTFLAEGEVLSASDATVAIYGGTFQLGVSLFNVIGAYENATVILAGGEYATVAESDADVICIDGGAVKVLDGKFYLADAGASLINGAGAEIFGGFFYAQESIDLSGAEIADAYTERVYTYEDPTFPANTKLDCVKEQGYLAMTQVAYDEAWLSDNGYDVGTTYDVTNGVYNEYPVSYYSFELERAFWYLGNGGSLTVTQNVELELDAQLTFRSRPQTSVVTLNSVAAGDAALALNVNVDGYALVATGGVYNISNLKLINDLGSAVLLDQDNTDSVGSVLNLQGGASVAGYKNHVIWIGAYATLNVYDGAYVSAAAGVNGNYDGTGFALVAMVGGELNVYGGALGYERVATENGQYVDRVATAKMNTVAVGVQSDSATCVSNINIYNGKLGKSATDMSNNATAIFNLTDQSDRIDGTKLYIENGVFNASMNNIIRCNDRNIEILIKNGTFNGSTTQCTSASHSDLIWVSGISADVHTTLVVEGGTFTGGRDQFNINGYARVSISNTNHSGARSAVFSLLGNPNSEPINVTNVTVNATVVPFYCDGSKLNVTGGEFTILRSSWGHCGFQLASNAATAGDITVTGGVYNIQNGYFVTNNGSAKRTLTLNNVSFNNVNNGSGICMNDSGGADVIVNGGVFSNMTGTNHLIETYGNPDKAVGSLTINGDARFVKGGSASGRMIKYYGANNVTINGGYFQSSTSEAMVVEKSGNHSYEPSLTLTINGGTFYNNAAGYSLIYFNSNTTAALIINGGTFLNEAYSPSNTWAPCIDYNSKTPANIYGGDFASLCPNGNGGGDSCVSVGNATLNVYAGTFRSNGMCVIRGLAGKTDGETNVNGSIQTAANSRLNIYGGVFTLENNAVRAAGNYTWDAVVRCGGGSTYAFVSIYGGTFIDNSTCSNQVISKNNVHSSINITGGVFLASAAQEYYFKSNGMAATGGSENPKTPLEKKADDLVVNYGGKQYHQLTYGTGASPFNGKMENGAQIRVVKDADGNVEGGIRFVTRYSAASVASLKSFAGGSLDAVSFGTLIVESALLEGVTHYDHAGLDAANVEYIDIVAEAGISGSESDGYTVVAALSNISAANYQTAYSAIGYTKVTLPDGGVVYFYTEYNEEYNSRSIAQVAEAALADVSDSQSKGYVHPHITMDGMFSRYTVEEQTIMQSYIATPEVEE